MTKWTAEERVRRFLLYEKDRGELPRTDKEMFIIYIAVLIFELTISMRFCIENYLYGTPFNDNSTVDEYADNYIKALKGAVIDYVCDVKRIRKNKFQTWLKTLKIEYDNCPSEYFEDAQKLCSKILSIYKLKRINNSGD